MLLVNLVFPIQAAQEQIRTMMTVVLWSRNSKSDSELSLGLRWFSHVTLQLFVFSFLSSFSIVRFLYSF